MKKYKAQKATKQWISPKADLRNDCCSLPAVLPSQRAANARHLHGPGPRSRQAAERASKPFTPHSEWHPSIHTVLADSSFCAPLPKDYERSSATKAGRLVHDACPLAEHVKVMASGAAATRMQLRARHPPRRSRRQPS